MTLTAGPQNQLGGNCFVWSSSQAVCAVSNTHRVGSRANPVARATFYAPHGNRRAWVRGVTGERHGLVPGFYLTVEKWSSITRRFFKAKSNLMSTEEVFHYCSGFLWCFCSQLLFVCSVFLGFLLSYFPPRLSSWHVTQDSTIRIKRGRCDFSKLQVTLQECGCRNLSSFSSFGSLWGGWLVKRPLWAIESLRTIGK